MLLLLWYLKQNFDKSFEIFSGKVREFLARLYLDEIPITQNKNICRIR